ncbi:unnamed protein product [Hydatigera taeniaeformis]|uniref:Ovule protein n=1 Tax=Hydatigena taeniaeformis TaxID=6205 RepID=A0A0R3XDE8_HYDTA|nr:unnamed protein product [Hydatigera taeniaeformis]
METKTMVESWQELGLSGVGLCPQCLSLSPRTRNQYGCSFCLGDGGGGGGVDCNLNVRGANGDDE